MNSPRYSLLYSRFHGCTYFRNERDLIVLDFADKPFDNWDLLPMIHYQRLHMNTTKPFAQALKAFCNVEAPVSVVCQNDSWSALLGNLKTVSPMLQESATFQLYATPYFVKDPACVAAYLQGMTKPAYEHTYRYKNCILYLDRNDLPSPGGTYFEDDHCTNTLYRICLLSNLPVDQVVSVATEWQSRTHVLTLPFLTQETITRPKMIPFQPVPPPSLHEAHTLSTGLVQKRLSMRHRDCLIQDILTSYYRTHAFELNESDTLLQQLGLVMEWPLRLTFEGTRPHPTGDRRYVALAVNGQRPTRVLFVRYPYDAYTEYDEVPVTHWTPIHFTPTFLNLPPDMEKVSIDSVVIGFVYQKGFYCFSFPLLEGRPTHDRSRNVDSLLKPVAELERPDTRILETFRYNDRYSLHRIALQDVKENAWCLTRAEESHTYPTQKHLPKLVGEWLELFEKHAVSVSKPVLDVKMIPIAVTLARHKICFKTKIDTHAKRKESRITLSDQEIEMSMGPHEVEFINSVRVENEDVSKENEAICVIM